MRYRKSVLNANALANPVKVAIKISGVYVLMGALWILLSDKLLGLFVREKDIFASLSMVKGWLYVLLTGTVLFNLIYAALKKIVLIESEMRKNYGELQAVHDELAVSKEELRRQLDILHHNAYYDSLTGLPNRSSFYSDLSKYMNESPQERRAIFFIDSDNFKFINDTMGHTFGDRIIVNIGKRLASLFDNDCGVYRLSGDEFVVCFYEYERFEDVVERAERIMQAFSTPLRIDDSILHTSVSIGISTYPEDGANTEELMRNADIALYQAKTTGKNKYVFFNREMQETVEQRMMIEKHLRNALQNNEFHICYQPQLDLKSGKILGFEALLRWNNAELGPVPPLKFIGVAEETHQIIPIGEWVLRNACFFLKELHVRGYKNLVISVNVSILQLLQENFVDTVTRVLEFIKMDPKYLELEITESILMESYQAIIEKLYKLKEIGVRIALDDFGQGYSSLSYLKQLPIDTLKIDKSFVDSINNTESGICLTGIIVMIGRKMGLTILAEGVEEKEQMDYLIKNKCHRIQGYLISKPLPQEEVIKFYEEWDPKSRKRIGSA